MTIPILKIVQSLLAISGLVTTTVIFIFMRGWVPKHNAQVTNYHVDMQDMFSSDKTGYDKSECMDILTKFASRADKVNLLYFLCGKSLVGSWNHHGFIPWQSEVQICVDNNQKLDLLLTVTKMESFIIREESSTTWKLYYNKLKMEKIAWPYMRITFVSLYNLYSWSYDEKNARVAYTSDVFPLVQRPFEGRWFKSPRNPPVYLQQNDPSDNVLACTGRIKTNQGLINHTIPCDKLQDLFPYVMRRVISHNNKYLYNETLRIGSNNDSYILDWKIVEGMPPPDIGAHASPLTQTFSLLFTSFLMLHVFILLM